MKLSHYMTNSVTLVAQNDTEPAFPFGDKLRLKFIRMVLAVFSLCYGPMSGSFLFRSDSSRPDSLYSATGMGVEGGNDDGF